VGVKLQKGSITARRVCGVAQVTVMVAAVPVLRQTKPLASRCKLVTGNPLAAVEVFKVAESTTLS
jgi:hypothetical protein